MIFPDQTWTLDPAENTGKQQSSSSEREGRAGGAPKGRIDGRLRLLMEQREGSHRRVAEPQGLRRLLRNPEGRTRITPCSRLQVATAAAAVPSTMARNSDLEAAIPDPDHTPKPNLVCAPHRFAAAILVEAVVILGLVAALVNPRARCDTALALEGADRCVLGLTRAE